MKPNVAIGTGMMVLGLCMMALILFHHQNAVDLASRHASPESPGLGATVRIDDDSTWPQVFCRHDLNGNLVYWTTSGGVYVVPAAVFDTKPKAAGK